MKDLEEQFELQKKVSATSSEQSEDSSTGPTTSGSTDRPPGMRGVLVGLLMWLKGLLDAILEALRD